MTHARYLSLIGLLLVAFAWAGAPALGQNKNEEKPKKEPSVKVGDQAPVLKIDKVLHPKIKGLAELKGRLLLYEFFQHWCGPCKQAVPHMNELAEKFGKRGFAPVYITDGEEDKTKTFIEDTKLTAPVMWDKNLMKTMDAFGFDGYPSSALIGPTGKVLWVGDPRSLTEKMIEDNLAGVVLRAASAKLTFDVELPKKNAATAKLLATGKIGEGRAALKTALEAKNLKEEDQKLIEEAASEIDAALDAELKAAETAIAEKRYFDAQTTWKRLSAQCKGLDAAKTADEKLSGLAKDASLKKEIEAGARIAEAQKASAAGKNKQALGILKSLGEGYLKDTEEAKRAQALAEEIQKT